MTTANSTPHGRPSQREPHHPLPVARPVTATHENVLYHTLVKERKPPLENGNTWGPRCRLHWWNGASLPRAHCGCGSTWRVRFSAKGKLAFIAEPRYGSQPQ
jgi:hypothetical protein